MSIAKTLKTSGFLTTTAAIAVLALGAFSHANAQQGDGYQGQGAQGQPQSQGAQQGQAGSNRGQAGQTDFQRDQQHNVEVSDEKLEKFASVQDDLAEIQEDNESSSTQEARDKMIETIEDSGLSLSEYNEISRAVRVDPELRKKYEDMAN